MARNPNKQRCTATTKDGRPCPNFAMPGYAFCRSHQAPEASAQLGNQAAQKHGLYGRYFREEDLSALAAVATETGLDDEIALARVAIRRLAERIDMVEETGDAVALSAALFNGAGRVAGLLKAQRALSGRAADGVAGAIAQALDELSNEWGVQL